MMYLTRTAGIETFLIISDVSYPPLRESKHDIYRTFIIVCHDVSYPHCGN